MSSKRMAVACAALALAIVAGLAAQDARDGPGPLERRANPITPENPVPRRTYSIAPAYPAEASAIDASAVVSLRVTLDEAGRVAEIRRATNPIVTVPPGIPADPAALRAASDALVRSAAAALRQWTYDAPATGPISFGVAFSFRPGIEPSMSQDVSLRPPPPPPPPPPPAGSAASPFGPSQPPGWGAGAVRVGSGLRPPTLVRQVRPVYPPIAESAKVQGVVILEAIVGADGRVSDARILRSIPLLDQAAIDAVRQWEYTPTVINGVAVPVIMTVTVQFTLT